MRNVFIGFLIVAAIVVGGGFIAQAAYQAGLSTAITTAAANAPDGSVVTPVAPGAYPYGYGYGYGHGPGWGYGFSIFGFLGTLLFIFLIIGLLRAVFWRGPGWGGRRWGGGPGQLGRPRPPRSVPGDIRRLASPGARAARSLERVGHAGHIRWPERVDPAEGPVGLSRRSADTAPSRSAREGASMSVRCSAT